MNNIGTTLLIVGAFIGGHHWGFWAGVYIFIFPLITIWFSKVID